MHIPENYLSPSTCAVMGAVMVPVWLVAVSKVRRHVPQEKLPLLGIAAALSFLSMMFNVPLPGGTTGHAVGGTLIAILFGPYAACLSVSVALLIQALFFGDGGILAFGANCFNMAFVLPFTGYAVYQFLRKRLTSAKGEYIAAGLGALYGLLAALIVCTPLGLLAAGTAWGEWDPEELADQDFLGTALGYTPAGMEDGFSFEALFPDYAIAGLPDAFGYILSALIGTALLIILFKMAAPLFRSHTDYGDLSSGR